jgi:hypothetical protein
MQLSTKSGKRSAAGLAEEEVAIINKNRPEEEVLMMLLN